MTIFAVLFSVYPRTIPNHRFILMRARNTQYARWGYDLGYCGFVTFAKSLPRVSDTFPLHLCSFRVPDSGQLYSVKRYIIAFGSPVMAFNHRNWCNGNLVSHHLPPLSRFIKTTRRVMIMSCNDRGGTCTVQTICTFCVSRSFYKLNFILQKYNNKYYIGNMGNEIELLCRTCNNYSQCTQYIG